MTTKFYSFTDDVVERIEAALALLDKAYRKDKTILDFETYHHISQSLLEALNAYLIYRLPIARGEGDDRVKIVSTMAMNAMEMPEEYKSEIKISLDSGVKRWE
jgi:hypothetical protein